jgi:2-hydroxychromene-2-carboxylate isomerase
MSTLHSLGFFFDPISPFAWLAFEALPQALEGLSVEVRYQPIVFGAVLKHHAHKGPAEIEPKRQWTFRQVAWLAHRQGTRLQTPAQHPFNPLPLLRLAQACAGAGGTPNRRVVQALFEHVWCRDGADANDASALAALEACLAPARDPRSDEVKAELRSATEAAIALGIFGVPTFEHQGRLFWGLDSLPMLREAMQGDPWFEGRAWVDAGSPRAGLARTT